MGKGQGKEGGSGGSSGESDNLFVLLLNCKAQGSYTPGPWSYCLGWIMVTSALLG